MPEHEFSIEISANVVAWYGAIVATASAAFSFYNIWKDRAQIVIRYQPGMFVIGNASPYKESKKHLVISVVNTGTRPINISQAYVQLFNSNDKFIFKDSFIAGRLRVLDERSPKTDFLAAEDELEINKIYKVVIVDGFGREHIKRIKYFPTILKLYYKFLIN